MPSLKSHIKQNPIIYRPARACYWGLRSLRNRVLGTKVQEHYWANRHQKKGNDWNNTQHVDDAQEWVKSYWDSKDHPHRSMLVECIAELSPVSSILEIGCNCGPNLYLLAKRFPKANIRGIDINPLAVEYGNERLSKEEVSNVVLSVGKADKLDEFEDDSVDVLFTDGTMIYIAPDKIKKVVSEMFRVGRKALIFVEQHGESLHGDIHGAGAYDSGVWKRDYRKLLGQFVAEGQIHLRKIPNELWPDENWGKFGYIIEVIL